MEEEFRNTYDQNAYTHEVLADFGVEEAGVFNKEMIEKATLIDNYTYSDDNNDPVWRDMDLSQAKKIHILEDGKTTYRPNIFRTLGVDWDYMGSSNLHV